MGCRNTFNKRWMVPPMDALANISLVNPKKLIPPKPKSKLAARETPMMAKESSSCASLVDSTEPSLELLIEQSKAGSREAFGGLVERYEKRVFHFLCRMAGNPHDAEDLTQDTFLKVYQNLHRFNSAQGFSTWLFTIAKRTAFNHFRGAKRFQELSGPEEVDLEDPAILLQ